MQSMAPSIASASYNFDSLVVPYRCIASDITAKKPIIFKSGDLALAVRASMAFPFYYPPVLIGENILYDGGIYNNFPTDVMLKEFNPDIIIGVSAAGLPDAPSEGNFLSQLKTMIVQTTVYSVPRKSDFLIEPDIKSIGVFDYDLIKSAIDSGYLETLRLIPELKNSITREADHELLKQKRDKISNSSYSVVIDQIFVYGVNEDQAEYIRKTLNPFNKCLSLNEFKKNWFKLVADDNQRYLFPRLVYNPNSGNYDLLLDVRKRSEYDTEHVLNAINMPLDYINDNMHMIDKNKNYFVHCAAGYRSMIFISILKARGYNNFVNVESGFNEIKKSGRFKLTEYVSPTTML
jgi:NTE family protein